jgi:C4-type Zn-finger protein
MIIEPHQGELMEFHVFCAKCGIHKIGTIVAIW